MLLVMLMVKKVLERFMKKKKKKKKKKTEFKFKKQKIEKGVDYMPNGKVTIIHLIVGLTKKTV